MTRLALLALLVLIFACTVANRETSSQDSTAVDSISDTDTTGISSDTPADDPESGEMPQDSSQLDAVYDEQLTLATNDESKYYIVSVRVSQYEGGADVTWHFDKTLAPRYFQETWSMEGNEGSTVLMIRDDAVECSYESDNYSETKWCAATGGVKTEGEEETTTSPIDASYGATARKMFDDNLATLRSILKDGTITSESPDSYVVRIEATVDVGQEVTEYTEVDIPKVVYDELMK